VTDAVLIRAAAAADLDAVQALLRETWHQVYDPILGPEAVSEVSARWHARARLERELQQKQSSFLVALERERVVAHGFAYWQDPDALVVSRLYVRPGDQRRGIGGKMLAALMARHASAAVLRLFVAADNARGLSFWRREGFVVEGEAIEEGARVLHMSKRLPAA
jgi:ribosomal protein S18 acetylase RimI-like enzyme